MTALQSDLMDNIFSLKTLWQPGLFLELENVNKIAWHIADLSKYFILLFTILEFGRMYYKAAMNEGTINPVKPFIKIAVFMLFVIDPLFYTQSFNLFFVKPFAAITDSLTVSFKSGGFSGAVMGDVEEKVKESVQNGNPMFGIISEMGSLTFFASLVWTLSFIGLYLISLVQQIYICVLYCLGPIVVPFFIFEPFQDVFMNWIKKVLSVLSWSIIGNIVISIIFFSGLFELNILNTGLSQIINVAMLSLCLCVVCWTIPKISDSIFGAGLDAGLSAGGMVGGAVKTGGAAASGGSSLAVTGAASTAANAAK